MKIDAPAILNKNAFSLSQFSLRNMRIKVLRRILLLTAAISAGLFGGFFGVSLLLPKQNLEKQLIVGDDLVIANPRFIGHSTAGGKITIVAEKALRSINGNDAVISLVNPHVTSGSGADLVAVNGIWNQATQELELSKNVVYKNSNGDNATSDLAYWMANDPRNHDLRASVPKNAAKQEVGQPLTWLIGNVQLFRKSGEKLNADLAIWNERTGVLDSQGNVILTASKNRVTAKNIKFDRPSGHAYAKGGVTVTTEKVTAQSETLDFDNNAKTVYGFDNVIITSGGSSARAKSYEYNLDTKRMVLKGGVSGLMVKEN